VGNLFEVTALRSIALLAAAASIALIPAAALAQRQAPTPEQRLERLEKQLQQVQRTVYPKGRPADTAGFSDEPAATQSSVATLDQRLDALERQMSDILRQSEENGHRLQTLEGDLGTLRTQQDQRITALEQRAADAAAAAAVTQPAPAVVEPPSKPASKPTSKPASKPKTADATPTPTPAAASTSDTAIDAGEDAYTQGFHLWEAGKYDEAIAALRAFTSAYPKHRRASYANNLIGRSLLDKGDARAAAEALLANYRANPKGDRASDSLYYLGQALMQLRQPAQACKAYAELEDVYGKTMRPDLKKLIPAAKAQAQCS
jgi:TolA-binding protein